MSLLLMILYVCPLVFCDSDSILPDENVEKLMKFKADLDDIGADVETLAFDIASELVRRVPSSITTPNPTQAFLDSLARTQANNMLMTANQNVANSLLNTLANNPANNLLQTANQNALLNSLTPNSLSPNSLGPQNNVLQTLSQNSAKIMSENAKKLLNSIPKLSTDAPQNLPIGNPLGTMNSIPQTSVDSANNLLRSISQKLDIENPSDTINTIPHTNIDSTNNLLRSISEKAAKMILSSASDSTKRLMNTIPKLTNAAPQNPLKSNETPLEMVEDTLNKFFKDYNESFPKMNEKKRSKRDVAQSDAPTLINVPIDEPPLPTQNNSPPEHFPPKGHTVVKNEREDCKLKLHQNQVHQQKEIDEMNEELQKLYDLVALLRNQQKTITLLDEENKGDSIPSKLSTEDLLNILEHFNQNRLNKGKDIIDIRKDKNVMSDSATKPTDLKGLKARLRDVIVDFNRTAQIIVNSNERDVILENQIMHQGIELNLLKTLVEKLVREKTGEVILGAPPHLPKDLPTNTSDQNNQNKTQARSSDLEKDLSRLLDEDKKDDLDSSLNGLENELEDRNKEQRLQKLLKKIVAHLKGGSSANTEDKFSKDLVRKVEMLAKVLDKARPQSRIDDSMDLELRRLENAIDRLKPKDDFDFDESSEREMSEREKLKILLNRLGLGEGRDLSTPTSPPKPKFQRPNDKVVEAELKKRLDKIMASLLTEPDGNKEPFSKLDPTIRPTLSPTPSGAHRTPFPPYPPFWYGPPQMYISPYDVDPYPQVPPSPYSWYRPQAYSPPPGLPLSQDTDENNQFFREPAVPVEPPFDGYHPGDGYGGAADQPGAYPPPGGAPEGYHKTEEDRQIIANLEGQINELREIINHLSQEHVPPPIHPVHDDVPRPQPGIRKRSERSVSGNEMDTNPNSDSELFDHLASRLKEAIFEDETPTKRSSFDDVEDKIESLKTQLGGYHEKEFMGPYQYYPYHGSYHHYHESYHPYHQPKFFKDDKFDLVKAKKQSILNSVVGKILDKIIGVIPVILEKLFGSSLYDLFSFDGYDGYYTSDYNGGYGVYENGKGHVKNLFKSLGVFGYVPLVVLKLIDGFSTFIGILKKNKFLKNFLVPALMLLLALGAIVFLIWWMQPDDQPFYQLSGPYPYGINHVPYRNADGTRYNSQQRLYNSGKYNVHSLYRPYNKETYNNYNYGDARGYSRSYFDYGRSALRSS